MKPAAVALLCALLPWTAAPVRAGQVELVSRVAPDQVSDTATGSLLGGLDTTGIFPASLSADGRYVAFLSPATNLAPGEDDRVGVANVFVRDRVTGATTVVSRSAASPAVPSDGDAESAVLSPNGRYVAWAGWGGNVVPGQPVGTFRQARLFLFDRSAGTNRLLVSSEALLHTQRPSEVRPLSFSGDGRFLLFLSAAPDVVPGESGDIFPRNAFLYDLKDGTVALVSHAPGSLTTATGAQLASMSADARYIAFDADGPVSGVLNVKVLDRVAGTLESLGNGFSPLISRDGRYVAFRRFSAVGLSAFLYDRGTRKTVLVSRSRTSPLQNANAPTDYHALSPDGRYVAFVSRATDVVPGQSDTVHKLFLFDRKVGTVKLVSQLAHSRFLSEDFAASPPVVFGGDGRSLAYVARVQVPVRPLLIYDSRNVFLYDLASGSTKRLSVPIAGSPIEPAAESYYPLVSDDGRTAVFVSSVSHLVDGVRDFNEAQDVFAYSTSTGALEVLTSRAEASVTPARGSHAGGISADGRWIVFESDASHLASGQRDPQMGGSLGYSDVFLYDSVTRSSRLVSHASAAPATAGNWPSEGGVLSADGGSVAFTSAATNLAPGQADPEDSLQNKVYLYDRIAGSSVLVSRSTVTSGRAASGDSRAEALSADGRYLAFTSTAGDLVPGQSGPVTNSAITNVFLYDRAAGSITLVSHSAAGPPSTAGGNSSRPLLSADGRFLLYYSQATDLLPGQAGSSGNLFLWDRDTGATSLVSHARSSAVTGSGGGDSFSLSADGRYVAFTTSQPDLAADPGGDLGNVYLYDRTTGENTLLVPFFAPSTVSDAVLSADGRTVAFVSNAGNLVPGQSGPPGATQVFLYDVGSRTITLASRDGSSATAGRAGNVGMPALSADGRYVTYLGNATTTFDIFLFDRTTGVTQLADPSRRASAGAGDSFSPRISADGGTVVFTSFSPDLVAGDDNRHEADAFLYRTVPLPPSEPVTVPPCALLDTHRPADGPALRSNVRESVKATGVCGVPSTATAVLVKVTALQATGKGNLRLFPGGSATSTGILRFAANQTQSSSFTVPVGPDGTIALLPFVAGDGTVQAAVEVDAYTP